MDWKHIIGEIQANLGLTQSQIAAKVGVSQVTISELANGKTKEPKYGTGRSLVHLYRSSIQKQPPPSATTAQPATENVAQGVIG